MLMNDTFMSNSSKHETSELCQRIRSDVIYNQSLAQEVYVRCQYELANMSWPVRQNISHHAVKAIVQKHFHYYGEVLGHFFCHMRFLFTFGDMMNDLNT